MRSVPVRQSGAAAFERKLRACNPQRNLVRTLAGTATLVVAVGLAVYVALFPQARF